MCTDNANAVTTIDNTARIATIQRNARISTAVAIVCLLFPLGVLPANMTVELITLGVGLVALLAAAHFSAELKKARAAK